MSNHTQVPDNFYGILLLSDSGREKGYITSNQLLSVSWSRSVNSVDTCTFVLADTDPIVRNRILLPFDRIYLYRGGEVEWAGLFLKFSHKQLDVATYECFSYEICLDRVYSTEFVDITEKDIGRAKAVPADISDPDYRPFADDLRPTRWSNERAHEVVQEIIENTVGIRADDMPAYAGDEFMLRNPAFVMGEHNNSLQNQTAWQVDFGWGSDDTVFGAVKKVAGNAEGAFDVKVDPDTHLAICNFFAPRPLYADRTGEPARELRNLNLPGKIQPELTLFPHMMADQTWDDGFDFSNYGARILLHLPQPLESTDAPDGFTPDSPWKYLFGVTLHPDRLNPGENIVEPNPRNNTPRYDEFPKYSGAWIGGETTFRKGREGLLSDNIDNLVFGVPHLSRQFHLKVNWTRVGEFRTRKSMIEQAVNDNRRGVVFYRITPSWKDDIRYGVDYRMGDRIKIAPGGDATSVTVDVEKVTGKYDRENGEQLQVTLVELPPRFTFEALEEE